MLRQEEYLWDSGRCPKCLTTNVDWGVDYDSDGNTKWQINSCMECGVLWQEVYELTCYEILQEFPYTTGDGEDDDR